MKCVIYARVSSKEQEKEGFSIPAQLKLLKDYANRNSFKVAQEFIDVETAKRTGRVNFEKMVAFLKSNPDTKAILVEKTDRLYRNFRDYVTMEELDVEIHLVKESEVISKDSRSHAKFIHGIKVLMAKNYIDNLSEEVRKGMREKAEQGEWPQRAPVGYINNKNTHLVEVDPFKSKIVVRLFELYSSGDYSLKQLKDRAFSEGLKSGPGKPLSKSMIESILKNPFYYGEFLWNKNYYRGNHQPLISKELFDAVQERLHYPGKTRPQKRTFAFGGVLKCGYCGCSIVGEIKKSKYIYYHCTGGHGKCDQPYLRQEKVDGLLAETVKAIQIEPQTVQDIIRALKESQAEEKNFRESELSRLRRQNDNLQARLDKSYEDRLDGIIDKGYWRDVTTKWRTEQDTITQQINRLTDTSRNYVESAVTILELSQKAYSLYVKQDPLEKKKLLKTILSNCVLKDATLYPSYRKPFDLIVEGRKMIEKLPRQDSNLRPGD